MSVVVAVKHDNRIWMGADTQSTCGTDRFTNLSRNDYKIVRFRNGLLFAWTGETASRQVLLAHPEWFNVDEEKGLTKEHIVTQMLPNFYQALSEEELLDKGESGVPPLMNGKILLAYKDKLFLIQSNFQVLRSEDYQAIGSGSRATLPALSQLDFSKDINAQLLSALKISAKLDTAVSAPFVFIDTKGLKYTVKEG